MGLDKNTASSLLVVSLAVVIAVATIPLQAEEIYKWTDEQGNVHFSNRPTGSGQGAEPEIRAPDEEGWESQIERQRSGDEISNAADSAINSRQAKLIRRRREQHQAQTTLQTTQAEILRAQSSNPSALPDLRAREMTQIMELRRIDAEVATIESEIAKLRAVKRVSRERTDRPAPIPFGE